MRHPPIEDADAQRARVENPLHGLKACGHVETGHDRHLQSPQARACRRLAGRDLVPEVPSDGGASEEGEGVRICHSAIPHGPEPR